MKKNQWLKKYTKIEYLHEILETKQLHLGDPASWDDQNDWEAIRLYSTRLDGFDIRATCLTQASDRFHFWHIFGERECGVCLWFEQDALVSDIEKDASLIADVVRYPNNKRLRETTLEKVPFTKREQYRDELEFRILRIASPSGIAPEKFKFSAPSLRKIYLNPWLSAKSVVSHKRRFRQQLKGDLVHVELYQNRSLRRMGWINALSAAAARVT